MICLETIRFSGSQFRFGVETFNNAAGKSPFGVKPVQQQRHVSAQLSRHFHHLLNFRVHGFGAPQAPEGLVLPTNNTEEP